MPPFADRELPADFEISPIAPRKYGRPFGPDNPSPGKPKGCIPKITRDLKEGIVEAAERVGSDGQLTGGLTGFLEDLARHHKRAFASLLVKLLPMQVSGNTGAGVTVAVNVQSIPSGSFLTQESIERLYAPRLTLEHAPQSTEPGHDDAAIAQLEQPEPERFEDPAEPEPAAEPLRMRSPRPPRAPSW